VPLCPPQPFEPHPESSQARFDFDAAPAAPPAVDPHLVDALKRIHQEQNQRLLSRLEHGAVDSDELECCKGLYGKRPSARLHDIRVWLWALGHPRDADPLPGRCLDAARGLWAWQLTAAALQLARRARG